MKKILFFVLVTKLLYVDTYGQCSIVSDTSGTIYNDTYTDSANYTVSVSGASSFNNLGSFTACNLTFPSINAPWSGNTNSLGTTTYTFSTPVVSLKVFIAYVGTNTQTNPESFTFTTNGALPTLLVNPGSCQAWTTIGNQITSPLVINALNSIVTVSSTTPFTTLSITSGTNSSINGGSSYGLCETSFSSPVTGVGLIDNNFKNKFHLYPNPANNYLMISNTGFDFNQIDVIDLTGKSVASFTGKLDMLDIENIPAGAYFITLVGQNKSITKRFIKQ